MICLTLKPKPSLDSSEFPRLAEALRIPEMFTCCNINVINHALLCHVTGMRTKVQMVDFVHVLVVVVLSKGL